MHTSDGPAAQNIIRDISVRIATEKPLSFGRYCVGKHTPECARDSRFLDDFIEPAYRLHLGRRGTPLCFACYAGAPPASAEPQPRAAYSVLADRTLKRWPTFFETPDGPLRRAETMPTPTALREARPPNPPPCDARRASLHPRLNPALQAHEQTPTRHAKGIFTMAEIRAAIILDQHLASTTPEARTRRPAVAYTWPLHPLSLDTRSMLGTQVKNNTTTYKVIHTAPSDNRIPINLEDLYAWVRPLNEPRHKGQSLCIGSTMPPTKLPPLKPPPHNNSPLYDPEIILG